MSVYSSEKPITRLEDMEYSKYYPISHLSQIIIGRGRKLDEALNNDPFAPAPIKTERFPNRKHYTREQIESYMNYIPEVSDAEKYIQQEIDKKVTPKEQKLYKEIEKLKKERELARKDAREYSASFISNVLNKSKFVKVKDMKLKVTGIYFLYLEGELQYVGQSVNIFARLAAHINEKNFDEVRIMYCSREELNDYEGMFIRLLRPPLNGQSAAPMSRYMMYLDRLDPTFLQKSDELSQNEAAQ